MVTVPEAFIIESDKTAAERDHLRETDKLKDQRIAAQAEENAALKQQNGLLRSVIETQSLQVKSWMEAATERKAALGSDDKAFKLQGDELIRARADRDKAERAKKGWGIGGLVVGFVTGYLAQRR